MLSNVLKKNITTEIAYGYNKLKVPIRNSKILAQNSIFWRESELSEIQPISENGETREEQFPVKNILSKFRIYDPEPIENNFQYNEQDVSENNNRNSQLNLENNNEEWLIFENNLDFHQNAPLSIEIIEQEIEENEAQLIQGKNILKTEKEGDRHKLILDCEDNTDLQEEELDDNWSPWIGKAANKLSPFQNFK